MLLISGAYLGGATMTQAGSADTASRPGNLTVAAIGPSDMSSYQSLLFAKSSILRGPGPTYSDWPKPPSTISRPASSVRISPSGTSRPRNLPTMGAALAVPTLWLPESITREARSDTAGLRRPEPGGNFSASAFRLTRRTVQVIEASPAVISRTPASLPAAPNRYSKIRKRAAWRLIGPREPRNGPYGR